MNIFSIFIALYLLSFFAHSETIEADGFEELSRSDAVLLRRTPFFKRVLEESELFYDKKTVKKDQLGRLISIKEKITGVITKFQLKFLGNKGFNEINLEAIPTQNIVNFLNLEEEEFQN